jgi:methylmalonyl-CoA mutase N-terminal domain/subunit
VYPFTRGIQPTMYRRRLWTMRRYAGYAGRRLNRRYKYLPRPTGLSVARPAHPDCYACDQSPGGGGKVGVSISARRHERPFDGILLDKVSTSMTINAPASVLLALYIAVARRQGVTERQLRGTIQNDILKEYIARGTYIYPPAPSMRLITDIFRYCRAEVPQWNTISISGYHIREAGSTAVQEVAFTLANGIAYVQAALDAGLPVDEFASQLSFFFNAHNPFLEEVAKFRAARRMWAAHARAFGARDPRSWMLRFHTQTGGSTLTAQQPANNVVRVALQALAAVMGGTQSLHTNSLDEALALPTESAVRIALRTQQIIAHEAGVADTIDPLAGSYAIEALTDEIEQRANAYLQRIDELGGALRAIETGYMQREIQDAAYRWQRPSSAKRPWWGERVPIGRRPTPRTVGWTRHRGAGRPTAGRPARPPRAAATTAHLDGWPTPPAAQPHAADDLRGARRDRRRDLPHLAPRVASIARPRGRALRDQTHCAHRPGRRRPGGLAQLLARRAGAALEHGNGAEQQATVAFRRPARARELVQPITDTRLAKFLVKRGPGLHHICFEVDDLAATLADLAAKGVRLIDPMPKVGAGGKLIAFVHPESTQGVLVELYQEPPAG